MIVKTSPEQPFGRCEPRVHVPNQALIGRVRAEYREMPGLCLTVQQACRLWQIDATTCACILDVLVADHVLKRTATGAFILEFSGTPEPSIRHEVTT